MLLVPTQTRPLAQFAWEHGSLLVGVKDWPSSECRSVRLGITVFDPAGAARGIGHGAKNQHRGC